MNDLRTFSQWLEEEIEKYENNYKNLEITGEFDHSFLLKHRSFICGLVIAQLKAKQMIEENIIKKIEEARSCSMFLKHGILENE